MGVQVPEEVTMTDIDRVVSRLRLATEQAEAVQADLSHRQNDLLQMEDSLRGLATGEASGLVVVDRAEDLRRTLNIDKAEQLTDIHLTLTQAESAIRQRASDDETSPDVEPPQVRLLDVAIEEVRRAMIEIFWIDRALTPTCQCVPSDPDLGSIAQRSIDESANRLEHARRSVFRLVEDLPFVAVITQEMLASGVDDPLSAHLTVPPDPAPRRSSAATREQRRPTSMPEAPDAGFGPDR